MTTYNKNIPRSEDPIQPGLRFKFDVWIALAVAGLLIAGMLVVYSASLPHIFKFADVPDPSFYLRRQFIAFGVGMLFIIAIMSVDYHWFRYLSLIGLVLTAIALILVLVFGESVNGSTRMIFGFQPSEFAKISMLLYTSHWLSAKGSRVKTIWYGLVPFSIVVGGICGLIYLEPDLSTALVIAAISFTLFFLAGADWKQIVIGAILIVGMSYIAVQSLGHATGRIADWQTALNDPLAAGDQQRWAIMSLSIGHIWGRGIGQGVMKYRLQVPHTDGPFAVWGEEWGFVGCMFIILSYMFLAWRGILAAKSARDMYGFLLAMGVTVWISYQALMNIAVITSTIPFTGIPLPFMSAGGSSLLSTMIGVGILLNVSRDALIGKTLKKPATRGSRRESR